MTMIINWLKKHHILHSWGKWAVTTYEVTYRGETGDVIYQDRSCQRCGRSQSERL